MIVSEFLINTTICKRRKNLKVISDILYESDLLFVSSL